MEATKAEVEKLLKAGFFKKATYTTWLTNIVLVKKFNGNQRMCTNYTDLNKVCLKGTYSLLSIDKLMNSATDHVVLSFLNTYSGCNQISMYHHNKL